MPSLRTVFLILAILVLAAAGAFWFLTSPGAGGTVAQIKQRGTLVVGVREDVAPFSKRNSDGDLIGFEPDLARDLAKRLGVELELKAVEPEAQFEALQSGEVDLVLAAATREPELADTVHLVEPAYYAGGANVLVRVGSGLNEWEDLEGRPVCAVQGAGFNQRVSDRFGARVVVFRDTGEALQAFDTGECGALLSDESWLISLLVQPDYADYDMPLSHIEGHHWHPAMRRGQPHLRKFIKRAVEDWHSSGKILELERTWNMRPSEFAQRMNAGEDNGASAEGSGASGGE